VRRFAPLLIVAVLAAGCGGSRSSAPTATTTTEPPPPTAAPTTTAPQTVGLRIYLLRDGKVAPVARAVPRTRAVGTAAVNRLLAGPATGESLTTAMPGETELRHLAIADGVATAEFSQPLQRLAQAQVVYTLTQFPSVHAVSIDGGPRLTRSDFEDATPQILLESPLPGATVTSPIRISGTADTFEATFQADVLDATGKKIASQTVTATSGSGQRGTYDTSLAVNAPPGPIRLVVYEVSAADGSHLHQVEIPLTLANG
jgi:germination protein M